MTVEGERLSVRLSLIIIPAVLITLLAESMDLLVLIYSIGFSFLVIIAIKQLPTDNKTSGFGIGYANIITIGRELGLLFTLLIHNKLTDLIVLLILILFLLLDLVDGHIARKLSEETEIGAILDIEADASFTLLITTLVAIKSYISIWFVGIGLLRYIYVLILNLLPNSPKPERRSIISIGSSIGYNIIICTLWIFQFQLVVFLTYLFGFFVIVSFIRDFHYRLT